MESLGGKRLGGTAYMNAYLNGMQFVLLALEGRLSDADEVGKDEVLALLYEYHELAMRMRERSKLGITP